MTQKERKLLIKLLIIKCKQTTKQENILVTQYPKDRYLDDVMKVFEKGQPQNSSVETSPKKDKQMPTHR